FDNARAEQLVKDVHAMLRAGGVFLMAEPTSPEPPFADGFEAWKAQLPPRYTPEKWMAFWSRANALLGYDHPALFPRDRPRIDERMTVAGWIDLLRAAGFQSADVLLRDTDQVIIGAVKTA